MKQVLDVPYTNTPLTKEAAAELLSADLDYKEITSVGKIEEWFRAWGGQCYVSFSGGKDSTVLAYIVANWLSHFKTPPYSLTLVFVNTGLEYPEIQHFVNYYSDWLKKRFPSVTINLARLRPQTNVRHVIEDCGYPVVGKEVAQHVDIAKRLPKSRSAKLLKGEVLDPSGNKSVFNCEKWGFLVDAPFKISAKCCDIMKKNPVKKYEHKNKSMPILATMADESIMRTRVWKKTGCNAFDGRRPISKPMSFWTEQDVLTYIVENEIPIAPVYGDVVACEDGLRCTSCQRTGCVFCGFGVHREKGENRFQQLRQTHPRHWDFCINGGEFDVDGLWKPNDKGLGWGRVLDYIGVPSV